VKENVCRSLTSRLSGICTRTFFWAAMPLAPKSNFAHLLETRATAGAGLLLVACRLPPAACRLLLVACRLPLAACCLVSIV
jgi:hypothetical protein